MEDRTRPAPGTKRTRTRKALLEATRAVVAERGYRATTLEAVAERAGMTTGAIYSNFRSRNHLFVALGEAYWTPLAPEVPEGASFRVVMRALAAATLATLPGREGVAPGRLIGMAHTLQDPALQHQVEATTRAHFELGAEWLEAVCPPGSLPMPAPVLVAVVHALAEGLVFQRILTPALVPDAVVYAAFEALAGPEPAPEPAAGASPVQAPSAR